MGAEEKSAGCALWRRFAFGALVGPSHRAHSAPPPSLCSLCVVVCRPRSATLFPSVLILLGPNEEKQHPPSSTGSAAPPRFRACAGACVRAAFCKARSLGCSLLLLALARPSFCFVVSVRAPQKRTFVHSLCFAAGAINIHVAASERGGAMSQRRKRREGGEEGRGRRRGRAGSARRGRRQHKATTTAKRSPKLQSAKGEGGIDEGRGANHNNDDDNTYTTKRERGSLCCSPSPAATMYIGTVCSYIHVTPHLRTAASLLQHTTTHCNTLQHTATTYKPPVRRAARPR